MSDLGWNMQCIVRRHRILASTLFLSEMDHLIILELYVITGMAGEFMVSISFM